MKTKVNSVICFAAEIEILNIDLKMKYYCNI